VRINPIYSVLLGDAVIPLAGFFFWDWSLYFILLFYLIDLASNEVFLHFKARKIWEYQQEGKRNWLLSGIGSGLLAIAVICAVHGALFFIEPGIRFGKESYAFWTYEELGVQQGYLLVPLVIFAGYQQYKMTFLMPGRFRSIRMEDLWKRQHGIHVVLLGVVLLAVGIYAIYPVNPIVYVLAIVVARAIFTLRFGERLPTRPANPRRK